ncbi:MAG: SDR family oxidoreductase [Legionella sp.]|jgi:NAD(P)-dependent dehydrogenase (short-subunit alcohol dehydrogenase family)|nr:SDR family oxidoreductase [Legionella sp.]
MRRMDNKIVLITGASRGIGAETARLLVEEGARVILTDIRDQEGQALADTLGAYYEHLDVASEAEWRVLTDKITHKYSRLDALFNNAGIIGLDEASGPQDPEHASLDSWHHVHAINLDGVFLGCKYGIQMMKAQGGSIINMSSRSGMVGIPAAAAYASSKAAVRNHTKTVALYCAEHHYNIRCNSLHPGAILTPLWNAMLGDDPAMRDKMIQQISAGVPLGHMGDPKDVAYAVLYLLSDESKYVTGTELTLDGGILAGSAAAPRQED